MQEVHLTEISPQPRFPNQPKLHLRNIYPDANTTTGRHRFTAKKITTNKTNKQNTAKYFTEKKKKHFSDEKIMNLELSKSFMHPHKMFNY